MLSALYPAARQKNGILVPNPAFAVFSMDCGEDAAAASRNNQWRKGVAERPGYVSAGNWMIIL